MKTLLKDTFREIKNSLARFLSILLIIALGVGFFAGVKATAPDMKITADKYFKENKLMDYHVLSTMGFEDEDKKVVQELEEIEDIELGYSLDVLLEEEDKSLVMNLYSLPTGYKNSINQAILVEGRMPTNRGECLLESTMMDKYHIGSRISLDSGRDEEIGEFLNNTSFTVVGFANSPRHLSTERGKSNIGNGRVNSFIIIPEREFKLDFYTDMYVSLKNPDKLNTYSEEYKDYLEIVKKKIDDLGKGRRTDRHEKLLADLEEKYEEGLEELEKEKEKGEDKLKEGENKFSKGKEDLKEGEALYSKGLKDLETETSLAEKDFKEAEDKINQGYAKYNEALESFKKEEKEAGYKISAGKKALEEAKNKLGQIEKSIEETKLALEALEDEEEILILEGKLKELEAGQAELVKEIGKAEEEIKLGEAELKAGKDKLDQSKAELDRAQKDLDEGKNKLAREKSQGEERLKKERSKLDQAIKDLEKAEKDLKDGREELEREVSKGERELKKLEREIKKLEKPEWFILKRTNTMDYIDFEMAADRIDAVAKVFPLFFFLIALLVCLTTMTRMVDEQRVYIGVLKGLGYSDLHIMTKYIIYSLIASILGSILGLLIGFKVFPTVIFNAYRIMYIMPPVETVFNIKYALISLTAAVLTTSLASYLAVRKELKEVPANLLRPKAPLPGKRILLERIDPIWKRLKFSQKVTARNIFRYKRRLFMTIIGIAGCTALLLAGFGLKDSIMGISINQFDKVFQYDMDIDINDGIVSREMDPIVKFLKEDDRIESFLLAREDIVELDAKGEKKIVNLMTLENTDEYDSYIRLQNRRSQEKFNLEKGQVLVSEKLARLLDLEPGDDISIDLDEKEYSFKVDGLTENYAYHYIFYFVILSIHIYSIHFPSITK